MTRTGQAAIDAANAHVGVDMAAAGYCLQFTRECFDVAALYGSAIDAWNGARVRHPGDRNPPPAVPVYFSTPSVYDHVAIRTEGSNVVSTFNEEVRRFSSIADIERQFSGTYLGWAEDINGVTVYAPDEGEDWMSALTNDEQRRVLAASDQVLSWGPKQKEDTDRLPHIHYQVDQIAALSTNTSNGVGRILDILGGITAPGGRALALTFLVVLVAAVIGVIVGVIVAAHVGAWTGAGILAAGLIGAVVQSLRTRATP